MNTTTYQILLRTDTATNWDLSNPVLDKGEIGIIEPERPSEPAKFKIGTGIRWIDTPPAVPSYPPASGDATAGYMEGITNFIKKGDYVAGQLIRWNGTEFENYLPMGGMEGPYNSTADACLNIRNIQVLQGGRLVNFRLGKFPLIWNNGTLVKYWWPKGRYADGDLIPFTAEVLPGSISVEKTNFIQKEIGKNKFNKNAEGRALGSYLNENTNSQLFGKLQANEDYNTTELMPVTAGVDYVINKTVRSVVFFDINNQPIPGSGLTSPVTGTVIKAPEGAVFVRMSIAVASWDSFQFEIGIASTASEPYSERFVLKLFGQNLYADSITPNLLLFIEQSLKLGTPQIKDRAITPQKVSFLDEFSRNLYNPNDPDVVKGKYLTPSTGLADRDNEVYKTTGFIKVNVGDVIVHGNNGNRINLRFICGYGADKSRVAGSEDQYRTSWTVPPGVVYIRTSFAFDTAPLYQIQKNAITAYEPFNLQYHLKQEHLPAIQLENASVTAQKLASESVSADKIQKRAISADKLDFVSSDNLFDRNDPGIAPDIYLGGKGAEGANMSYIVSGYIPVQAGQSYTKSAFFAGGAYSAFYTNDKVYITDSASNAQTVTATQDGFIRVSVLKNAVDTYKLAKGTAVGVISPYQLKFDKSLLPKSEVENVITSIVGQPAKINRATSLEDGASLTVSDFPYHLKKGFSMSFYADIEALVGNIQFGKGIAQYRGDWIMIDANKIYWKHFESAESTRGEIAHGLNISSFVKCSLYVDDSSLCTVILQSLGGFFKTTFQWVYEANFAPFLKTTGQMLTSVAVTCASKEFQRPVWAFTDSYGGVASNRWPGVMKSFGFFNFLLNGLAGQGSANALLDLQRCLNYGTPKYLLWCLGMNDSDSAFQSNLNSVISICRSLGITLILSTIPTVPARNKEIVSDLVRNSGYRYIDFYKAVGANPQGQWHPGYLYSDGVHPDLVGAQALATQILVDFPELMQYGMLSTAGNVGETIGDK